MMTHDELKRYYPDSAESFKKLELAEERILLMLSVLRLLCFAGGIALVILAFIKSSAAGILALTLITFLFLYLLKLWGLHSGKKEFNHNLYTINRNEAEALNGNIFMFADGGRYASAFHDFSNDIDLFGSGSLFQSLNRTVTAYGSDVLASWLSDPFRLASELSSRQEAVRELSSSVTWRQQFMASGMNVPFGKENISALAAWLNEDNDPGAGTIKRALNIVLPSIALILLIFLIAGIIPYQVFIFFFLINLFYVGTELKKTNRIHNSLTGNYNSLASVRRLLNVVGRGNFESPSLKSMQHEVSGDNVSASVAVRKLERLIQAFDSRLNFIAGFLLNGLLLWDLQCVHRLMLWKREYKQLFPSWLSILGEMDAYSSLANYSWNNPDFSWPVRSDSGIVFSAANLGHPLIDRNKRVSNDFTLDAKGCIVIITGANMAGKSTFLRTVAVNYVLAMCGAPVCADSMVFTPVKLFTSMRTTDSLQGNESYFYAELKRLRSLKEHVSAGEPMFFILDEILKGTNSADKATGSRLFMKKITGLEGTGLIATHDTSLGELENEFPGKISNMSFEIDIDGENILFDYKLNPGITKKMNAAFLMKQMGILD